MSLTLFALTLLPVSQSAMELNARDEQARLNACIETIETDPDTAYEDSLAWLSSGYRPKARYCNALALIAMNQVEEGAARLEALANAPDTISLQDRALYMTQAGNAWFSAGYPDAAITSFNAALNMRPNNADLLVDRAAAQFALEAWLEGIDDLDRAIGIAPGNTEAYYLRARALLETGEFEAAQSDLDIILKREPENIDFLVLRGDLREAKRLKQLPR